LYGSRREKKLHVFNGTYRIPAVQRSREKRPVENAHGTCGRRGSAEVRFESPTKRGDFHDLTSPETTFAVKQLAEGEELGSNILHVETSL
jgi:hypothetical protein